MYKTNSKLKIKWSMAINRVLAGKTIREVRYQTDEEMEASGWMDSAVVIIFTDGSYIIPMADDEGNNAGAISTSSDDLPTIPVI